MMDSYDIPIVMPENMYHGDNCMCSGCCQFRDNRQPDSIQDGIVDRETMKRNEYNDRGISDT